MPVIVTLSAILMWPTTPTAPANTQFLPIVVLPAIPHFAASAVLAPILTLCAICTRLSIITPCCKIVSSNAPRSILQFDPIRTSSAIRTEPSWAIRCHYLDKVQNQNLRCQSRYWHEYERDCQFWRHPSASHAHQ